MSKLTPKINSSTEADALDFSDSIAFKESQVPLTDMLAIYATNPPSYLRKPTSEPVDSYGALEFVPEWCVQEFNTSAHKGTATTTRLYSSNKFRGGHELGAPVLGPAFNSTSVPEPDADYTGLQDFVEAPRHYVDNGTHYELSNYLHNTMADVVYNYNSDFF